MVKMLFLCIVLLHQINEPSSKTVGEVLNEVKNTVEFNSTLKIEYTDSVQSESFDFIKMEPIKESGEGGYFVSYYIGADLAKVRKYSFEGDKEFEVYFSHRNQYSYLWLVFLKGRKIVDNGFFLNVKSRELFYFGFDRLMLPIYEEVDKNGSSITYEEGSYTKIPDSAPVNELIDKVCLVDSNLFPTATLHYKNAVLVGLEKIESNQRVLNVYDFRKNCEANFNALGEIKISLLSAILRGIICFDGKKFFLIDEKFEVTKYYSEQMY